MQTPHLSYGQRLCFSSVLRRDKTEYFRSFFAPFVVVFVSSSGLRRGGADIVPEHVYTLRPPFDY